MSAHTKSYRDRFPAFKPSHIFIKVPKVDTAEASTHEKKAHALFETEKRKQMVVEYLSENEFQWADMKVELKAQSTEISKDHPDQLHYKQHLVATKENGDFIDVVTQASSWFRPGTDPSRMHLSSCGERATAEWTIVVSIEGRTIEFVAQKKNDPHSRGTSAFGLLDGDKRISSYFFKPLMAKKGNNIIVPIKQMYASFEKVLKYIDESETSNNK